MAPPIKRRPLRLRAPSIKESLSSSFKSSLPSTPLIRIRQAHKDYVALSPENRANIERSPTAFGASEERIKWKIFLFG
jgi:hypothetical protein